MYFCYSWYSLNAGHAFFTGRVGSKSMYMFVTFGALNTLGKQLETYRETEIKYIVLSISCCEAMLVKNPFKIKTFLLKY